MKKTGLVSILLATSIFQYGCTGDGNPFGTGSGVTEEASSVPAVENFRVSVGNGFAMEIFDPDTYAYTAQENTLVVNASDRNGLPVDNLTVTFAIEWGTFPGSARSCVTDSSGSCEVTWGIADVNNVPNDYCVRVVAYATGEESFKDANGDSVFDDSDTSSAFANIQGFTNGFIDVTTPYFDRNWDGAYTAGTDLPIPGFGSTIASDGKYNGSATCTTTNFCSATTQITIWDTVYLDLKDETTATTPATSNTCTP